MILAVLGVLLCASPLFAQSTECNTTPPLTATVTVGQAFTLGWCDATTNGGANPVTGYKVLRNGTLLTGLTVTTDTANGAGQRYSHVSRSEAVVGTVTYAAAATNSVGDSASSPTMTVTVNPVPTVPSAPTGIRVTVP